MTRRETRSFRVDPETWSEFIDWVVETEGQKRGEVSRHVENALEEYIDHGREARIEQKVDRVLSRLDDAHTHKHTEASAKVDRIAEDLAGVDRTVLKADTVRRAIEEVAGADDRTIAKYERLLKRQGLAYEHPSDSNVWTTDRDHWLGWAVDYVDNNPSVHHLDVLEDYPIEPGEYERKATAVVEG